MSDIEPVSINMNNLWIVEELNSILKSSYINENTETFEKNIDGEPSIISQEAYKKIRSLIIEIEHFVNLESILNSQEGKNATSIEKKNSKRVSGVPYEVDEDDIKLW